MLQDHLAASCAFAFGAEERELLLNCSSFYILAVVERVAK